MALFETKTIKSEDGIAKRIEDSSMSIALDILQRGIYAFPIKSTVRELASNAYDAIKERDTARAILTKNANIEDFFDVTKSLDGIHENSGWDPSYFDLNWLSDDPHVYIYYEEGTTRDTLRFVDYGVGLGKDRLVGYFHLNYSSKRANKTALGRWGLGSKVAFSLGVDSFRVINRYNGKRFIFDVFLDKVESLVPKFGKDGENEHVEMVPAVLSDPDEHGKREVIKPAYIAYYEPTTEKNGLELIIEVKKHSKNEFFTAMESQLMYLNNIKIKHRTQTGLSYTDIDYKAKIVYRDDNIVISDSNVYDKPHILLGVGDALINYGFVNFPELELEPRSGSAGLVLDINDIDVTPSRESPIWSPKTRETVLNAYRKVITTVTEHVSNEMKNETDYLSWLVKCSTVKRSFHNLSSSNIDKTSDNYLLSVFSKIVDLSNISFTFPTNKSIKFSTDIKDVIPRIFGIRKVTFDTGVGLVRRDQLKQLDIPNIKNVYITKHQANMFKDRYLLENESSFILINYDVDEAKLFPTDWKVKAIIESDVIKDYDAIVVPEDLMQSYKTAQITDEVEVSQSRIYTDYRAIRSQNAQTLIHKYNGNTFSSYTISINDLINYHPYDTIIYGNQADRDILAGLYDVLRSKSYRSIVNEDFGNDLNKEFTIVILAQENVQYVSNINRFVYIRDFMIKKSSKSSLVFRPIIKQLIFDEILQDDDNMSSVLSWLKSSETNSDKASIKILGQIKPREVIETIVWYGDRHRRSYNLFRDSRFMGHLKSYTLAVLKNNTDSITAALKDMNLELPGCFNDKDLIETVDIAMPIKTAYIQQLFTMLKEVFVRVTSYIQENRYNYADYYKKEFMRFSEEALELFYNKYKNETREIPLPDENLFEYR